MKTKIQKVDILFDDGGHEMQQQITAFEELFDHIGENGIYLCEDIHASYLEDYGGGFGKTNTFLEYSKLLIDKFHAWHIPDNRLPGTSFTRQSESIHFYDGDVVIGKKARVQPWIFGYFDYLKHQLAKSIKLVSLAVLANIKQENSGAFDT